MNQKPVLSVKNLKTYFYKKNEVIKAVNGVSFDVYKGNITALIGESGCGKSITSLSIMNLIDEPGQIVEGKVILNNKNIISLSEKELMRVRGKEISMIFQDPVNSLNPTIKVKKQLLEAIKIHKKFINKKNSLDKCRDMLKKVGLKNVDKILDSYPFELSGGMCQRIMISMALLSEPEVIIADEPTTELDLTIQASILEELVRLREEEDIAILLITHDLGVVSNTADYVYVMNKGEIVEHGSVFDIFENPSHEYTKSLIEAVF